MHNDKDRKELLLRMYDQLFNDINRHILVIWQSVGVVVGAFALFALAEKNILPFDLGVALILALIGWLFAHLYDAAYWYNRNIAMVANIEKEFLADEDLKKIHYYFGKPRPKNAMLTHLKIQRFLGLLIAFVVLLFHFLGRVLPGIGVPWSAFDPMRSLPYVIILPIVIYLVRLRRNRNKSYQEFLKNSPGRKVDTTGIIYGVGHGYGSK